VDNPVAEDEVTEDDEDALQQTIAAHLQAVCEDGTRLAPLQDETLEKIRAAAARDTDYAALQHVIMTGFPDHCHELQPSLRPYWGVRSMLSVDDGLIVYGPRLVIPQSLRRETLIRLHDGHQGINRTKRRARQTVYWPGIDRDVENTTLACQFCSGRTVARNLHRAPYDDSCRDGACAWSSHHQVTQDPMATPGCRQVRQAHHPDDGLG